MIANSSNRANRSATLADNAAPDLSAPYQDHGRSGQRRRPLWRRIDATGPTGIAILTAIALACLFAPLITSADPTRVDLLAQFESPDRSHPFGTDNFGRDLFARVLYGGRTSLAIALVATTVVLLISAPLGIMAGYFGGAIDTVTTRLIDVTLAFPRLVLAIAIAGLLGSGLLSVGIAIVAVSWAWYARLVRGMVLQLREEPYVTAAVAMGASTPRIFLRHLLPALGGRIAVLVSLDFGYLILNVSALSFLGLGVQPPRRSGVQCSTMGGCFSPNTRNSCYTPASRSFSQCWLPIWSATPYETLSTHVERSNKTRITGRRYQATQCPDAA